MSVRVSTVLLIGLAGMLPAIASGDAGTGSGRKFATLHAISPDTRAGALVHSTMGLFQGPRASAHSALARLDVVAYTYTRPGEFILLCSFDKASPEEGQAVPHADLFLMNVPLDLAMYGKLFESTDAVDLPRWEGFGYDFVAKAWTARDGLRYVVIEQDNAREEDTRRGSLRITLRDSRVAEVTVEKWAKRRSLNPISGFQKWESVLADTAQMSLVRPGLALRDDGELGRVSRDDRIRMALDAQTPKSYREALARP